MVISAYDELIRIAEVGGVNGESFRHWLDELIRETQRDERVDRFMRAVGEPIAAENRKG